MSPSHKHHLALRTNFGPLLFPEAVSGVPASASQASPSSGATRFAASADGSGATTDSVSSAQNVLWDLDDLLDGDSVESLLDRADSIAAQIEGYRGRIASLDAEELAALMRLNAELGDLEGRAMSYVGLNFATDTQSPAYGAALAKAEERATAIGARLVFFEVEWSTLSDDRVAELLSDSRLDFCAHHLRNVRRYRRHILSEAEERVLAETSVAGAGAWVRLFNELTSAIELDLSATASQPAVQPGAEGPERAATLEQGLALLGSPDRTVRAAAAAAVTEGLKPGLKTRAYVFNTLLLDKSVGDRLRSYDSWLSSRNLANEATDESVAALIEAVVHRYDIAHRWYAVKAEVLGLTRLADYDRGASLAESDATISWDDARAVVLDSYRSFSPDLASVATRFFDESWIHAPASAGKQGGAFCAYTVPSAHPYLLLNWTGRHRDVLTLAHEMGHGLHAYLAREQGVFHQSTPLTLAETASVFGEAVTNQRMLSELSDPNERFSLLASTLEDSIATVFRQVAMNRFEAAVHTERREVGELSTDRFGELWADTQTAVLGNAVEVTDDYRIWWSYIPHFMATPGYVYAYAYGQLLALSVYSRYQERGESFVPQYLELLRAGGSLSPEELTRIVDCDLRDPGFWDGGLDIVEQQLTAAIEAARAAGRLTSDRLTP